MTDLVRYEAARKALAEAKNTDEVMQIHDFSRQMEAAGRVAKNHDLEADAAEIRLRAERRLGQLIRKQKETVGLNQGGRPRKKPVPPEEQVSEKPKLAEGGISRKLSSRAQRSADVDDKAFELIVADHRDRIIAESDRVTDAIVRESEKKKKRESRIDSVAGGGRVDDLLELVKRGIKFGCIYADPPWQFRTYSERGKGRNADQHYETMSFDDLKALPVAELASENCLLLMWMVDWAPREAIELMEAWGFTHKTTAFTWTKPNHLGLGYWTRANPEQCWLGTKGKPERLSKGVRQWINEPVGEHSAKPKIHKSHIEALVGGPYLELFGRDLVEGWTVWGNQAEWKVPEKKMIGNTPTKLIVDSPPSKAIVEKPPSEIELIRRRMEEDLAIPEFLIRR